MAFVGRSLAMFGRDVSSAAEFDSDFIRIGDLQKGQKCWLALFLFYLDPEGSSALSRIF